MTKQQKNRVRLTETSIANIGVATKATISPVLGGGFIVTVLNQHGAEVLKNATGDAVFNTISTAKRTVQRHNSTIVAEKEPAKPSPSMLPKVELSIDAT